ncbi:extracellular solute-binding protein [Ciceribacter sp. L1K22]|uniref:sugar ABC transporter substrate-binding protein n=1 Tax=Ciceribacter sp. L1K22 TaxID=2820275 RepID=UPI001ABD9F8D|nr:extracellular solute-binding protein [Ciceribacter sp. L1K22]MBO3759966.1 extracellular solute-binding protein [Ciceribacter sp. L1K22]
MKKPAMFAGLTLAAALAAGSALAATDLSLWYHGAGNQVEREILVGIIEDFNTSQDEWNVVLEEFPQAAYNDSVTAAALAGNLPDILDMDGPVMPNWAWSGYLQPLKLPEERVANFLPGAIGKWQGELYSVGLWDAAVAVFARKSVLEENNIRIPTLEKPWSGEEFTEALKTLKATGKYDYPLDLGMSDKSEWYPYAFSPFLQSFGGDLINRDTYLTAEGALNGEKAIAFGEWWQSLFEDELAPGTSQSPSDHETGFLDGKYAMQWMGNWVAVKALEKYGDDLLFLPAPDFGNGPKIGAGSWQFGISAKSQNPEGAAAFIEFAIQDKYLAEFSDAIGLVPATSTAAQMTENYKDGGPLAVFFGLSDKQGTLRPETPAYAVISPTFQKALTDIADGADVADTLDAATDTIDDNIEKNGGYGFEQN